MEFGSEIMVPAASAISGAGLTGLLVREWVKAQIAESREIRRDLEALRRDRVEKLETRTEQMAAGCVRHQSDAKLDTLIGQVHKIDAKLDLIGQDTAALKQARLDDRGYIENLDKSLQRHKSEDHG
jgi:hypothetical protein